MHETWSDWRKDSQQMQENSVNGATMAWVVEKGVFNVPALSVATVWAKGLRKAPKDGSDFLLKSVRSFPSGLHSSCHLS